MKRTGSDECVRQSPAGNRINIIIQTRRYRMFYYRITDTSDGSEQFLKPSDARKFLNLEDSALKAYADISGITMPCVTVYASPSDYPGWYVARLFDLGHPLNVHIRRRTVEEIRADIIRRFPGMIPFAPGADDEPCIVETWI